MDTLVDISKLERLPPFIQQLIPHPQSNKVPFSTLAPGNLDKAANYVKTKTAIDLLSPSVILPKTQAKEAPVILVLCQPSDDIRQFLHNEAPPYSVVSYVAWLEAAGAKCVPFPYNINEGSMQFLLERSHGMLLPGGAANLYRNYDTKEGIGAITAGFGKIYRHIEKMWKKGIEYPIWGTCLGLELMLITISNDIKILSTMNSKAHQSQVISEYESSAVLKDMPIHLRLSFEHRKLINFFHRHGITVKKFISCQRLTEKLKIISISKDKDNKWFCSALEGKDKPIFLTQYHPQKQAFEWTRRGDVLATKHSIEVSQYLAASFVRQCFRCRAERSWASTAELHFYNIHVFREIFIQDRYYKVFAIDFKYRDYDKEQKRRISQRGASTAPKLPAASQKRIFI